MVASSTAIAGFALAALSQFSSEDIEPVASFRSSDRVSVSTTGDGMDLVSQCGLTSFCERSGRGAKI